MKNILLLPVLALCLALSIGSHAQVSSSIPEMKTGIGKRWMISWTYGQTLSSPGKDLEKAMTESGFNDRTPRVTYSEYFFGFYLGETTTGGEQYTQRKDNKKYVDAHLTYSVTPKSALALHFTHGPQTVVKGYDHHHEAENFLTLKTKSTQVSMEYIFRTGPRNSGLSVGPVLAFHQVAQEAYTSPQTEYHQNSVVPGIHVGYELAVINSKDLFFGLNVNYNWFSKVHVGEIGVGDPNIYTSVFKPTAVKLDNVNLGITLGIKI
jgi:hypothetical protein